ncbi:uncharacterized protein (DUF1499 family) [Natronospira proteinivora]|uniref:Uncharacterized protein (DUF1499 family) n=1 Tax=Natronospira proteinivora TaxID=1807133 RepID=A0ABT1G4Z9_9GAMM|nr:DUF1499 domain-containing protein [Natronospira proteinivora]MCP1726374.1 uncharacterized protein (DUF1499 family) [Natronospira proteinivora]
MFKARLSTIRKRLPPIAALLLLASLIAGIALISAGPSYRFELLELSAAFSLLRYAAWAGLLIALLGLPVLGLAFYVGETRRAIVLAGLAIILGTTTAAIPFNWQQKADSVPPIHDITTDTTNPPAFQDIAPLREDAPNPVEYSGEETAEQQREAYPDIDTLQFTTAPEMVMDTAVTVSQEMGWELVSVDAGEGRIEATATTRWFGFKDDVVIRIRDTTDGSELDIRSKSRVGRSDVGTNAERIRQFRSRMEARLGESDDNSGD